MTFKSIDELLSYGGANKQRKIVAVAVPEDDHTLHAVLRAAADGFVTPFLVGDKQKILSIAAQLTDVELDEGWIVDISDHKQATDKAVELVREEKADFLMKGSLNTSEIIRAVLNKETGLPHGKLITDMALTELPGYHKLLTFADGGILPYPTLEQKADMIRMIVDALHEMGYEGDIKVGVLCAAETPNPKIVESMDAVELKKMNQEGKLPGCIVEGPISLDIALKPDVAAAKGFESPCAGDVDVLIMPNLVTGNVYSKSIEMIGAMPMGIVLGACCPITVVSRAAPTELKYRALVTTSMIAKKRVK